MKVAGFILAIAPLCSAADMPMPQVCGKLQYSHEKRVGPSGVEVSYKAVRGAQVSLFRSEEELKSGLKPLGTTKTNHWGNFKLAKVPDGNYLVLVVTAEGKEFKTRVTIQNKLQQDCMEHGFTITEKGELEPFQLITVD